MAELRRNPFRIPEGVDRVLSVRPRWLGHEPQPRAGYMVVRIWHDGRVEDVDGRTDRQSALSLARSLARTERSRCRPSWRCRSELAILIARCARS